LDGKFKYHKLTIASQINPFYKYKIIIERASRQMTWEYNPHLEDVVEFYVLKIYFRKLYITWKNFYFIYVFNI